MTIEHKSNLAHHWGESTTQPAPWTLPQGSCYSVFEAAKENRNQFPHELLEAFHATAFIFIFAMFLLNGTYFMELFSSCASKCFILSRLLLNALEPRSASIFFKYSSISASVSPFELGSSSFLKTFTLGTSLNLQYYYWLLDLPSLAFGGGLGSRTAMMMTWSFFLLAWLYDEGDYIRWWLGTTPVATVPVSRAVSICVMPAHSTYDYVIRRVQICLLLKISKRVRQNINFST